MGEITLNREDSMRVINDPEASPEARIVAASALAMFEVNEHAGDVGTRELSIVRKITHMTQCAIYEAFDELGPHP